MIRMGGKKNKHRGHSGPTQSGENIPHKRGQDNKGSRRNEPQEDAIQKLAQGQPPEGIHHVPLEDGDHDVAAAEADKPDLKHDPGHSSQ
jgi:hypothetical protein